MRIQVTLTLILFLILSIVQRVYATISIDEQLTRWLVTHDCPRADETFEVSEAFGHLQQIVQNHFGDREGIQLATLIYENCLVWQPAPFIAWDKDKKCWDDALAPGSDAHKNGFTHDVKAEEYCVKQLKLNWCDEHGQYACRNAPSAERRVLLFDALAHIVSSRPDPTEKIVITSFASGDMLQEYLLISSLIILGYRTVHCNLIDSWTPDSKRLLSAIRGHMDIPGVSVTTSLFASVHECIKANLLRNEQSDLLMMVDAGGRLLWEADTPLVNTIGIRSRKNPQADPDFFIELPYAGNGIRFYCYGASVERVRARKRLFKSLRMIVQASVSRDEIIARVADMGFGPIERYENNDLVFQELAETLGKEDALIYHLDGAGLQFEPLNRTAVVFEADGYVDVTKEIFGTLPRERGRYVPSDGDVLPKLFEDSHPSSLCKLRRDTP